MSTIVARSLAARITESNHLRKNIIYIYIYIYMCVCVCERERERERERDNINVFNSLGSDASHSVVLTKDNFFFFF